jgi:hypothetical protein
MKMFNSADTSYSVYVTIKRFYDFNESTIHY